MKLRVEVVLALPERQRVVSVELEEGATAADAVAASGLEGGCAALGRYGERIGPDTVLRDGDRVELLRPLAQDPKEARRGRARRARRR
jgi:putative ubiquitin-RnfH superfamily antitoxin RatB of RatAB toxin-antitoxin module